ncbi:MAG TPA: Uma2 family endonuclease [Aggregatilineaceae bacterium]|nr:Uma2 family endonuclease [Aggregatilineaceae bacterium]
MVATLTFTAPATLPAGEIVATDISVEMYMSHYAGEFHEWVRGAVIRMSPASLKHDALTLYLRYLLDIYFEFNPIGRAVSAPFVMRLDATRSFREPDVQIILNDNPGQLTDTAMIGPADICIEVVSPESTARDYGDKFKEYETAGVREYWIIDPLRRDTHFYQRQANELYTAVQPDENGDYRTGLLPKLVVSVATLWQAPLPTRRDTMNTIERLFKAE